MDYERARRIIEHSVKTGGGSSRADQYVTRARRDGAHIEYFVEIKSYDDPSPSRYSGTDVNRNAPGSAPNASK
jgi:hypothetical protein